VALKLVFTKSSKNTRQPGSGSSPIRGGAATNLLLPNGRTVGGAIVPENHRLPLSERALAEIRARICWLRDNEPAVRDFIAAKMFDGWLRNWYDQGIDPVTTRDQFRDRVWLAGLTVLEDRVALAYNYVQLFGGHAIVVTIASQGSFDGAPELWG
jgi:hypothetical protein